MEYVWCRTKSSIFSISVGTYSVLSNVCYLEESPLLLPNRSALDSRTMKEPSLQMEKF